MSKNRLKSNKYALVTGAATGIGLATSKLLAKKGWKVFSTYIPNQDYSELIDQENIFPLEMDITNDAMVKTRFEEITKQVGENGLAALVNNAGIANIGSGIVEGVSMKDTKFLFEVNVFGTIRVTQNALPLLRKYGRARIINLASGAVRLPVPFAGIYNMSKYAIEGLTNTLRYELAPFGIQVTSVEPSTVKSEMTNNHDENLAKTWDSMPDYIREIYFDSLKPTLDWLSDQIVKADPPEVLAKVIFKCLTRRRLKLRYVGGSMAKMLPPMMSILGENGFERMMTKMLKIPKDYHLKEKVSEEAE